MPKKIKQGKYIVAPWLLRQRPCSMQHASPVMNSRPWPPNTDLQTLLTRAALNNAYTAHALSSPWLPGGTHVATQSNADYVHPLSHYHSFATEVQYRTHAC